MLYTSEIQNAIYYIEENLHRPICLDDVASAAGMSKYHFHRIFRTETGLPLQEYIRRRRLSGAAALLRGTDISILDISLYFCFESQETFTRTFKRYYGLPPAKYRKVLKNLINGGSTEMKKNNEIPHWIIAGTAIDKYEAGIDRQTCNTGTQAVFIRSAAEEIENGEYVTVMQQFRASSYIGKRVRFSGFVRTEGVSGWCGLWMRLDSSVSETLKLDNMQNRPITGTNGWNHYSCVLDVPADAAVISIGVLLYGSGQIWFDNAAFSEVGLNIPTTDFDPTEDLPDGPENLNFEE